MDKELLALLITSEYLVVDSECDLFRKLPFSLSSKIELSVYNRRRHKLFPVLELIRRKLAHKFNQDEKYFVVDSMPPEVCKISSSSRSNICKEQEFSSPNRGYCTSQDARYYGYKLHMVCSIKGVIESLDISPASVHDIHYLKDIKNN